MKEYIFVIGIGRSGTTLLQSILNAHSQIKFIPETHFVKRYLIPEIKDSKYNFQNNRKLLMDLEKDDTISSLGVDIKEQLNTVLHSKKEGFVTVEFFKSLFEKLAGDSRYVGDKDPMNVNYLKTIKQTFPEAKIIHIIRDPRDVIASRLKSKWNRFNSVMIHIAEYKFGINKARKEGRNLFGFNYSEVKYENLIGNSEETINKLCDFLSIPFEQSMLSHEETAQNLIRSDEQEWKGNVLKPIMKNNVGNWQKSLSLNQVVKIESVLSVAMEQNGYKRSTRSNSLMSAFYRLESNLIERIFKFKLS